MSRSREDRLRCEGEESLLSPTLPMRAGERKALKANDSATAEIIDESAGVNRLTPLLRTAGGATPPKAGQPLRDGHEIGGYQILEELARGGMGVVYKAYQKSLNRTVALKMILRGNFAQFEDLVRFRSEAQAIARLHHPNLVSIFEIGEHDGLPFYAMEFLEGGSLATRLNRQPLEPRAAAELMLPLACAIDYAHSRGIIHRDLKPGNILFAIADAPPHLSLPKITDFGIAKQIGDASNLTRTGEILGTPAYMAPEQATGGGAGVGPAADVYSLGAILYETLTGRAPFVGSDGADTILRMLHQDATPPRKLNAKVPLDLETICLKCLEKDPAKRYPTAGLLADDLDRYLANEPIVARPASPLDRGRKWMRRRPVHATALFSGLLLAIFGVVAIVTLWQQALAKAKVEADMLQIKEEKLVEVKSLLAEALLERGISLSEKHDMRRGLHWMIRSLEVAESVRDRDPKAEAIAEAVRYNLSNWGQYVTAPEKKLPHLGWAYDVGFSPDGRHAVTASPDQNVRIWDTITGQPAGPPLAHGHEAWAAVYHPSGRFLFTGSGDQRGGEMRVYRAASQSGRFELTHAARSAPVFRIVVAPAGNFLVVLYRVGGYEIFKFDHILGSFVSYYADPTVYCVDPEFSADSKTLYLPIHRGDVQVFDLEAARVADGVWRPGAAITAAAMSPDRKALYVAVHDKKANKGTVLAWDLATREETPNILDGPGAVKTMAFTADGARIGVSFDTTEGQQPGGQVRVAELHHGQKAADLYPPLAHPHPVWSLAFDPAGEFLITGCRDANSRIWEAATGKLFAPPLLHEGNVVKVSLRPDGRQFLTASAGGNHFAQARLQEMPRPTSLPRLLDETTPHIGAHWFPDNRHFIAKDRHFEFSIWDSHTGFKVTDLSTPVRNGEFDLRNSSIVGMYDSLGKKANYYDIHTGKLVQTLDRFPLNFADFNCFQIAGGVPLFDRESKRLWLLRMSDGASMAEPAPVPGVPFGFFVNEKAGLLGAIRHITSKVGDEDVVTGDEVMVWDTSLKLRRSWVFKTRIVGALLNPEGDAVAVHNDYQIELLDLATGLPRSRPMPHEGALTTWFFHPGGDVLGYGLHNGHAVLLHAKSSKTIGKAIFAGSKLNFINPCPDGTGYLAGGNDSRPIFWDHLPPATGSLDDLRLWVEDVTGMTLDANDELTPIDPAELHGRRLKRS